MAVRPLVELRDRMVAVLTRQVITESDKKALKGLRSKIINDSTTKPIHVAKATLVNANVRVLRESIAVRNIITSELSTKLVSVKTTKRFAFVRRVVLAVYTEFGLWLRTPVTVGTVLFVGAVWALAFGFARLEFPWSYLGYTWGFGALFMTALTTARLTMTSQSIWIQHSQAEESPGETEREIVESELARKVMVLREIEEFIQAGHAVRPKEMNLKANAFLMRKRDWQSLQDALYDTFMSGAPPLMLELGQRLGSSVGRDLKHINREPAVILSNLGEVMRSLGWGIFTVHGDLETGARLMFRVRESPFSVSESPLDKNTRSCHLICGLVAGIAEEVYGWPCSSFERKCVREGHDYCEVLVTQSTTTAEPRRRWSLSVLFPTLYPWR